MKTYAESVGEKPFDWNEFLSRESHSDLDWNWAHSLARKWPTCACGNLCDVIPRKKEGDYFGMGGEPLDKKLTDLGLDFLNAIYAHNALSARITLHQIETRSAEILAQMGVTS